MYLGSRYQRPWVRRHVDSPRQNAGGGHSSSPFSLFVFDCHTSGTRHQTVNATSEGGVGLELLRKSNWLPSCRRPQGTAWVSNSAPAQGRSGCAVCHDRQMEPGLVLSRLLPLPSPCLGPTWVNVTGRSPLRLQHLQPVGVGHSCICHSFPVLPRPPPPGRFSRRVGTHFLGTCRDVRLPVGPFYATWYGRAKMQDRGFAEMWPGPFTKESGEFNVLPIRVTSAAWLHRIKRGQ
jgi:hypothetical protein